MYCIGTLDCLIHRTRVSAIAITFGPALLPPWNGYIAVMNFAMVFKDPTWLTALYASVRSTKVI